MAYRLPPLANDPSRSCGGHLDVSLQFDFLLRAKEVLLLQLAVDSALSLQEAGAQVSKAFGCR